MAVTPNPRPKTTLTPEMEERARQAQEKAAERDRMAASLSDVPTTEIECPTCIAVPGMRCVTKSKRWTKPHVDRNRRDVYMTAWYEQSRAESLERIKEFAVIRAEQERQDRIAAGKDPDPHPEECMCDDEECWPLKKEDADYGIQVAEQWLNHIRQQATDAERAVAEAERIRQDIEHQRYVWEQTQK